MGLACNIGAYIWKNLPFWTIILLAGRMAIPQELYEAAAVDGATGLRRFAHVTYPLMANLYLVCAAAGHRVRPGRLQRHRSSSPAAGRRCRTEVLATLGIPLRLHRRLPRLGVATVMSALPVLIPLVFCLMRKLRMSEGQL